MPSTLIPLTDYKAPPMPTQHRLTLWWRRAREAFGKAHDAEDVDLERLTPAMREQLPQSPDYSPLHDVLAHDLADWLDRPSPGLRVVACPPGIPEEPLTRWAGTQGAQVLDPPRRDSLLTAHPNADLDGEGVLVVPRLEDWFLRHHAGLGTIREPPRLADALQRHRGRASLPDDPVTTPTACGPR